MDRRNFLKTAFSRLLLHLQLVPSQPLRRGFCASLSGPPAGCTPFLDPRPAPCGGRPWPVPADFLQCRGNDVYVYDVKVDYTIGGAEHFNTRLRIAQGTSSRRLNLRYNKRFIQMSASATARSRTARAPPMSTSGAGAKD